MAKVLLVIFLCIFEFQTVSSWGYHGNKGPAYWGNTFPNCLKKRQSPIEITEANSMYTNQFKNFEFTNYDSVIANSEFMLLNNGHTVQLSVQDAGNMRVRGFGQTFKPLQIHFHWGQYNSDGSEHRARTTNHHPAEMHFVHVNTKYSSTAEALNHYDGLMVFGTIMEISSSGANNSLIDKFTNYFDQIIYDEQNVTFSSFPLNSTFVVDTTKYYHYNGSLTTPGCNEAVLWVVFKDFMYISQSQMDAFRMLRHETLANAANQTVYLYNNYRPLQARNGRKIYRTFGSVGSASAVQPSILAFLGVILMIVRL